MYEPMSLAEVFKFCLPLGKVFFMISFGSAPSAKMARRSRVDMS
jgi:hypothetical protein